MASAKKQEHLKAGKRRLEEFQRKKAAVRAKKSANHVHTDNTNEQNKQPVASRHEIFTDSDSNGAVTSVGVSEPILEPSQVITEDENGANDFVQHSEVDSNKTHPNSTYLIAFSTEIAQAPIENKELDGYDGSWSSRVESTKFSPSPYEKNDDYSVSAGDSGRHDYGFPSNQFVAFSSQEDVGSSNEPSLGQLNEAYSKGSDDHVKGLQFASPAANNHVVANVSHEGSGVKPLRNNSRYGSLLGTGFTSTSNDGIIL